MQLRTKDGWLLTEYTTKKLAQQFDGTLEELCEYVASHRIKEEPVEALYGNDNLPIKPIRYFIGEYDLFANKDGIIGTKEER